MENIKEDGPVILACNHPNSFLDPLAVTTYYKRPIYYIARGDVFVSPFVSALLRFLNIVPIYRREEGVENLSKNSGTFTFCIDVLKENGTILLFSEGISENEWYLRPIRKGTARLVYDAWNDPIIGEKLRVIPVAIHYSSWLNIKSRLFLSFKKPITKGSIPSEGEQGPFLKKFNELLTKELLEELIVIDKDLDTATQNIITSFLLKNIENGHSQSRAALEKHKTMHKEEFIKLAHYLKQNKIRYYSKATPNIFSFLIGLVIYSLGYVLNLIPYSICKAIANSTTKKNEFYDSVLFCTLLFLYPLYLIAVALTMILIFHSYWSMGVLVILILTAKWAEAAKRNVYSFLQRKKIEAIVPMLEQLFGKDSG
ncbi:MAG TPA: 1-acyl-sn-glycerol-3-phosphate acyltransferase [Bacteroidia bacterium]|nr:1-acyl-sn-glycerol-3-phosphate acyltransferase [Bacteroidia bacterium]